MKGDAMSEILTGDELRAYIDQAKPGLENEWDGSMSGRQFMAVIAILRAVIAAGDDCHKDLYPNSQFDVEKHWSDLVAPLRKALEVK